MEFQLNIPILERVLKHLEKSITNINGYKKEVSDTNQNLTTNGWISDSPVVLKFKL